MLRTVACFTVAIASTTPAQTERFVPAAAATQRGNVLILAPFATTSGRIQMIVDGSKLANTVAVIREISLRRDASFLLPYPRKRISGLKLTIGLSARTPATMSASFAENRSGPQTVVLDGPYDLPPQPAASTLPPWNITWKLTTPYLYSALRGDLLLDWQLTGTVTKTPYGIDAFAAQGLGSTARFGTDGRLATGRYRTSGNGSVLAPGGSVSLQVELTGRKDVAAVACFGLSNRTWGNVALPFDLGRIGAPGNAIYASLDLVLPLRFATTTNASRAAASVPIPGLAAFGGSTLFGQVIFADARANSPGLVTSSGVRYSLARQPFRASSQLLLSEDFLSPTGSLGFGTRPAGPSLRLIGTFR